MNGWDSPSVGATPLDLVIDEIDWLLTMDPSRRIIRNAAIAIRDGRIVVASTSMDAEGWTAVRRMSGRGKVVTPGLVDAHVHTTFQLARGLADDVPARQFLLERMYPYEAALDAEDVALSTRLCVVELVRNGVTTFVDAGNYHPSVTARVAGEVGVRAVVARSTFDRADSQFGRVPEAFVEDTARALEAAEETVATWNGACEGRIRAWFQFRGLNNASDELIGGLKRLADRYRVGLQTHAAFSRTTVEASQRMHGAREIERLARIEALGPRLVLAHAGWVTEEELELIVHHDVKVVAAPSSSFHNGYGNIAHGRTPELLDRGVAIGVGSDHASSGIVDILQELFLLSCGFKETRLDPAVMPAERLAEIATIGGARCVLLEEDIGSIEPGKCADLVLFDARRPEWQPLHNPVSNLVYSATGKSVHTVIVGGRVVVEGGRVLTVEEDALIDAVERRGEALLDRSGLRSAAAPRWPVIS